MRRLHRLLVLPAIVLALPVSAEIYRWTDSSGDTHFGSNPPAGVDAEPVTTNRTNTIDTGSRQNTSEGEGAADGEAQTAEDQKEGNAGQSPEDQQKRERIRQQNCETARQALKTLEQNARVQVKENGERRYLSPEEKAAERKRFERIREENCD